MKAIYLNVYGPGHVIPTLPIVRALVGKGWEVTYFTTIKLQAKIEAAGAVFHNYGRDDYSVAQYHPSEKSGFLQEILPAVAGTIPYLIGEVKSIGVPDLFLYDNFAPNGYVLGKVFGVPSVCTLSTQVQPPYSEWAKELPDNMQMDSVNADAKKAIADKWGIQLGETGPTEVYSDYLNLVFTAPYFQPDVPALHNPLHRFEFVGSMISDRPIPPEFPMTRLEAALSQGTKIVYVAFGSHVQSMHGVAGEFFKTVMAELSSASPDCLFLVALGPTKIEDFDGYEIPRNCILQQFVPQLIVLERFADVFVTHGGMNSVTEAGYYGVPLVVCPFFGDQPLNARRCADINFGLPISKDVLTGGDTSELCSAVKTVLSDAKYREGAQALKESLRVAGGVPRAVELVISLATK